ncbi:hypothetical protein JD844_005843 [Phrynosoma platyrhinos]|uniref:RHD domain-containing protein n=1 Tax=Phrynosoma platyrhinos TaxID=52577 RepID=A0ABQ7TNW6_PHRPL|nr:hypothetical protein JD844_005843 [Phrynosoma platyrhinos]
MISPTGMQRLVEPAGMNLLHLNSESFASSCPPPSCFPQDRSASQLSQNLNNLTLRSELIPRGPSLTLQLGSRCSDGPWPPSARHPVMPQEQLDKNFLEPLKLVITEQPKQRGMRFRYQCEGRSAGSILGECSTETNKTLPTIEVSWISEVKVTACLVWKDWPYRIHPHSLVGKDCQNGLCEVTLKPRVNPKHSFNNLGIQCVKKKDIEESIEKKLQLGIDPFKAGSLKNHQEVDMNVVRICFQASYQDCAGKTRHLNPVLSEPIFDKKDISIIFRKDTWEGKADFSQADVHRQIAIVFKTPPYQHLDITEPVEVEVYLRRLTDSVSSEPFTGSMPNPEDQNFLTSLERISVPDLFEDYSLVQDFSYSGPSLSDVLLPSTMDFPDGPEQEFLLDAYSVHSGVSAHFPLSGDCEPECTASLVGGSMFPSQYKEAEAQLEMETKLQAAENAETL